jgi:CRISPR type IV-associated protein Csf3
MDNLKITAYLNNAIAVYDNWSPSIEGLLIYRLLEDNNLLSSNPTKQQTIDAQPFIDTHLPLGQNTISGTAYWCTSSPFYTICSEQTDRYRKRWDAHDNNLNWGKRKPQFKTSEGAEKSYDLPLFTRLTNSISWYVTGDKKAIQSLLNPVVFIQKKRNYGNGQVKQWVVEKIDSDYHLWRNGQLMKPMPVRLISEPTDNPQLIWGWKAPSWLAANKELCYMPKDNVVYVK